MSASLDGVDDARFGAVGWLPMIDARTTLVGMLSFFVAAAAAAQEPASTAPLTATQPSPERVLGRYERVIEDLAGPRAVAFGPDGALYVAESDADRITLVSEGGPRRRLGEDDLALLAPAGLAVAPDGTLCVADAGAQRVLLLDADGKQVGSIGRFGDQPGDFNELAGVAIDRRRVYAADVGSSRVAVFERDGRLAFSLGGYGAAPGQFDEPSGVAVDESGAIYVVDRGLCRVSKFAPDGRLVRCWGEAGEYPGFFAGPEGIACAGERVLVVDTRNHRVQVFDLDGAFQYAWGLHALRPREGAGKFHYPAAIAAPGGGAMAAVCEPIEDRVQLFGLRTREEAARDYRPPIGAASSHYGLRLDTFEELVAVIEPELHALRIFDVSGATPILVNQYGLPGRGPGRFMRPWDVAFGPQRGRLKVIDRGVREIQWLAYERDPAQEAKFLPQMTRFERSVPFASLGRSDTGAEPDIVAIEHAPSGGLFLLDGRGRAALRVDQDGRCVARWGGFGDAAGRFLRPLDLAAPAGGERVYVVDELRRRVSVFSANGEPLFEFGAQGAGPGQFRRPAGVALSADAVYVTDRALDRVQKFDPDGRFLSQWGRRGIGAGEFMKPAGAVVDASGRLIVIDHGNHRAQIFDADGGFLGAFGARQFTAAARGEARAAPRGKSAPEERADAARARSEEKPTSRPLAPPLAPVRWAHELRSNNETYVVRFTPDPEPIPLNALFTLRVAVSRADGSGAARLDLSVDAAMPEHRHGMNTQPVVERLADGTFQVRGMLLHMPGRWELYFDVRDERGVERAQLSLELE